MPPAPSPRPSGLSLLAILSAVFGLESLGTAVRLFPVWLAAAKQHRYGSVTYTWVAVVAAASGFAAAYGLWRRRRWARVPFIICAVLAIATAGVITMFGLGDDGGSLGWVVAGLSLGVLVAIAGWLVRFVWRST